MIVITYQTILFQTKGGIARVTWNRPERLNRFSAEMHEEVRDALSRIERDKSARVLVLTGAGRGFCAGQDLSDAAVLRRGHSAELGLAIGEDYGPLVRR